MKLLNAIALLFLILCLKVDADDFSVISALPDRMASLKKEFHTAADTGATVKMIQAHDRLNEGIKRMLRDLIKSYYKDKPTASKALDKYFRDLDTVVKDEEVLDNPTGESQGSIGRLYVPSRIGEHLTDQVVSMVESIELDSDFDLDGWRKRWEEAAKSGD